MPFHQNDFTEAAAKAERDPIAMTDRDIAVLEEFGAATLAETVRTKRWEAANNRPLGVEEKLERQALARRSDARRAATPPAPSASDQLWHAYKALGAEGMKDPDRFMALLKQHQDLNAPVWLVHGVMQQINAMSGELADYASRLDERNKVRNQRLDALEARMAKAEENGVSYKGTWAEEAGPYERGDFVTWGGAMWACMKPTTAKPGSDDGARAWKLAVKAGRDGRDAKS